MRKVYLWLELRLLLRQKGRTWTLFFAVLLTSVLLSSFSGLGYYFWNQVHTGGAGAVYDATQWILAGLALVLVLLILVCAVALLKNLFSLTARQRQSSLMRLTQLGADPDALSFMDGIEGFLLYVTAASLGAGLGLLLGKFLTGVWIRLPLPMLGGIAAVLLIIIVLCGKAAGHYHLRERKKRKHTRHLGCCMKPLRCLCFCRFSLPVRGRVGHTFVSMMLAMLLYIPASYLINVNLDVHRSELENPYGIEYSCEVENDRMLDASLKEYDALAAKVSADSGRVYVRLTTWVRTDTTVLSPRFVKVLRDSGWSGGDVWEGQALLVFLEDSVYDAWMESWSREDTNYQSGSKKPAVLINRIINRTWYHEKNDRLFLETPLINNDSSAVGAMDVFGSVWQAETGEPWLSPQAVTDMLPEAFNFNGEVTIILPLEQLGACRMYLEQSQSVSVCGFFRDTNDEMYDILAATLEPEPVGRLLNVRVNIREWYASMKDIHRIMIALCAILLVVAMTNLFCTILFQYLEQRRSLAILWSVGESPRELLKMYIRRCLGELCKAVFVGILLSCILCYYIYKIYRYVWQTAFSLPWSQIIVVAALALIIAGLAFVLENKMMKRQNFLEDIRRLGDGGRG